MLPSTMQALKSVSPGVAQVQTVPLPQLREGYILVRVHAVALNPTDWKHVFHLASRGATVGCDYAGTVEQLGPGVSLLRVGDRVAGFAHGTNALQHQDGAFAQYAVVKAGPHMRVPDNLSLAQAATLGVGLTTVGQALYQSLRLIPPWATSATSTHDPEWLLVYGGSTATGSLAVQFARLSGMRVVATCSPRNAAWVEELGADKAFDYASPSVAADIRAFTGGGLRLALDCISEDESLAICADALGEQGGKISVLLPTKFARPGVEVQETRAYTVTGNAINYFGLSVAANAEDYEFGKDFWSRSAELFAQGKIKVHTPEVRDGGLQGIMHGLEDLKNGRVSGKKLVYTLNEAD